MGSCHCIQSHPDSTSLKYQRQRMIDIKQGVPLNNQHLTIPNTSILKDEQSISTPTLISNSCSFDIHYISADDSDYASDADDLYKLDRSSNKLQLNINKLISENEVNVILTPNGTKKPKPNLLRPDTTTPWNDDDIDEMTNDIRKQLDNLSVHNLSHSLPLNEILTPNTSNLYRNESKDKWEHHDIEETLDEMRKELKYLIKTEKALSYKAI